jgi:transcriptional regulator with XRE-family HTH domain
MYIASNLKLLRKRKGKSQEEVALDLNLTRSTYSGYENTVAQPNLENLLMLCDYYGASADDLLRKDMASYSESQWRSHEQKDFQHLKGSQLRILSTIVSSENEELIEMIPQKASAGYINGYADPEYLSVLPTFHLPFLSKERKYRSFPITGDSMPPVVDGSQVIGEYVQNWMTIRSGTPCIIVTKNEGIVFKIVNNLFESQQSLQLCSTNTFYPPYLIHVKEILEIWKFVNYISPELPNVRWDDNALSQSVQNLQKEVHALRMTLDKEKN